MLLWFPSQDWPLMAKLGQKSKKKEAFPSFLDSDLWFYRHRLNGTQFHGCRPQNRPNDVTNPFDFDKWRSTASRTSKSTTSTKKYLEIVRYESGLHHCKQLSNLKTADIYSTISMVASTGDTFPNTRGHISKYMGTHFKIHGDTLPNTWGQVA